MGSTARPKPKYLGRKLRAIRVEILGSFEKSESRVSQNRVVLSNEAKRESLGVLIVPLGTNDVIVHAAGRPEPVVKTKE